MTSSFGVKTFPAIDFPTNPDPGQIVIQSNGVSYIWNDEKESWDILLDSFATENFVFTEVNKRVSRYGDSMTGSLTLKQDPAATAKRVAVLGFDLINNNVDFESYLKLDAKRSAIYFTDGTGSSFIKKGGQNYITLHKTNMEFGRNIIINETAATPLFKTSFKKHFLLHEVTATPDDAEYQTGFKLTNSSKSFFGILNRDGDPAFSVNGTGSARTYTDSGYAFQVLRRGNPYGGPEDEGNDDMRRVFKVNAKTFKLEANKEYNKGLIAGGQDKKYTIKTPDGKNELIDFRNDALIPTVGFVKAQKFHPGENVCAEDEDDAQVGGLWRKGNSVYIRLA